MIVKDNDSLQPRKRGDPMYLAIAVSKSGKHRQ